MNFDPAQRAVLAGLADVLIPAGDGMPSASAAAVAEEGLNQVLAAVPSLGASGERSVNRLQASGAGSRQGQRGRR